MPCPGGVLLLLEAFKDANPVIFLDANVANVVYMRLLDFCAFSFLVECPFWVLVEKEVVSTRKGLFWPDLHGFDNRFAAASKTVL